MYCLEQPAAVASCVIFVTFASIAASIIFTSWFIHIILVDMLACVNYHKRERKRKVGVITNAAG